MTNRVLIVEGGKAIRNCLGDFAGAEEYAVECAGSGTGAFGKIAHTAPDIILLGNDIPGIAAADLCCRIKSLPVAAFIPVLFVTAAHEAEARIAGMEAGADACFTVPADPREIAALVRAQLRRKLQSDELSRDARMARELADKDHLTGLYNRRFFDSRLSHLVHQCEQVHQPLCVLTLDVDHFKRINDGHGHIAGDTVLREVARRIEANVRADDVACRVGGEEFIIIMPGTDLEQARRIGERLLGQVSKTPVPKGPGKSRIKVTVSVGVTCHTEVTESLDQLLERADQALYEAKAQGRNRVYCGAA